MASTSTHAAPAATKEKLTPVKTLEDHQDFIQSMAYFPDGKRIISGSDDKTARQWDMQAGKEIKKERDVCQWEVRAVAVSRNGRWVVIAGGNDDHTELKACEVETGIMKAFRGHSQEIKCIDISPDSMLLASGSRDETVRIWSLVTGKLIAGPFEGVGFMGAVRFSQDSKKLAVSSEVGNGLEVWDVQTQKSDVTVQGKGTMTPAVTQVPLFWTDRETILTAFNFTDHGPITIYEFDASTLKSVGTSFEGHTDVINSIALSFDGALLASGSRDDTIKLWDFESRHLLASFHVLNAKIVIFSPPDSRQLAYTTATYKYDNKIYICNIPADILARTTLPKTSATLQDLLESDATRRPAAVHRNRVTSPTISYPPKPPAPLHTREPQQHVFLGQLRKFLGFSSITDAIPPVPNEQLRDPLDIPATLPLPRIHSPSQATTQGGSRVDPHANSQRTAAATPPNVSSSPAPRSFGARLSKWLSIQARHAVLPIIDVPLAQGKQRNATAGAPKQQDEDAIPDEYFDDDDPPSQDPNSQQATAAVVNNTGAQQTTAAVSNNTGAQQTTAAVSNNTGAQQATAAVPNNTGEHGSGRMCFCF